MRTDIANDRLVKFLTEHEAEIKAVYKKSFLHRAKLAADGLLRGNASISDFKDPKSTYHSLLSTQVKKILERGGVTVGDHCVEFLGKKFFFVNFGEVVTGIFPMVIYDRYDTQRFLNEGSIVFDIGANLGIFSVLSANLCPKGKIYSFEPTSETFDVMRRNTEQYKNVSPNHNAVGDKKSVKKLRIKRRAMGANYLEDSIMEHNTDEFPETEDVEVVTIDECVREHHVSRVDFIKIDAEGYELNILHGAKETLKKDAPVMTMAAYHHPSHKKDIPEFVLSINPNYKYELRSEGNENFMGVENFLFWA